MADKPYKNFVIVLGVVLAVGLIYLAGALFMNRQGALPTEQINLASNAILTAITAVYVVLTLKLVRETRQQREQDIQPVFAIDIQKQHVDVKNVGNGPALDTEIILELIPTSDEGEEGKTESSNLDIPAGSSRPFRQDPFGSFGQKLSLGVLPDVKLRLQGSYRDMYGNEKEMRTRTYDLEPYRRKDYSFDHQ